MAAEPRWSRREGDRGGRAASGDRPAPGTAHTVYSAEATPTVVATIRRHLDDDHNDTLWWCSLDDVIDAVDGQEHWKARMTERYTDFTPIQEHLNPRSPLKAS